MWKCQKIKLGNELWLVDLTPFDSHKDYHLAKILC